MPEEKWCCSRAKPVSLPWDFSLKSWAMDTLLKKQIKQGCVRALWLRKMKSWLKWRPTLRSVPRFLALFLVLCMIDLLQRQMAHADKSLSDATTQNLVPTLTPNLWREKRHLQRDKQRAELGKQKMVLLSTLSLRVMYFPSVHLSGKGRRCVCNVIHLWAV